MSKTLNSSSQFQKTLETKCPALLAIMTQNLFLKSELFKMNNCTGPSCAVVRAVGRAVCTLGSCFFSLGSSFRDRGMPPETRRDGSDSSANRGSHIRIIAGLSEAQRVKKKKYHQRIILSDRVVVISEEFRCPICGKGQREVFQAKLMKVRQRSLVYV